jgi:hypothetical protein
MLSVRPRHLIAITSLGAALFGLPACGGQSGSPSKAGPADGAGGPSVSDGTSCGLVTVSLAIPTNPTDGTPDGDGCACDWQQMGADGSYQGDGGEADGTMFTLTCVAAPSTYLVECTCSETSEPDGAALGPCTGASTFSPVPGKTKNVLVNLDCPG